MNFSHLSNFTILYTGTKELLTGCVMSGFVGQIQIKNSYIIDKISNSLHGFIFTTITYKTLNQYYLV